MHLAEALFRDVGVDLRGAQAGMAQQLLDGPEVGSPVEQMGGVCVAKGMGMGR